MLSAITCSVRDPRDPYGSGTGHKRARTNLGMFICIFYSPYGWRKVSAWVPHGRRTALLRARKIFDTDKNVKIPHGCRMWWCGACTASLRSPHGAFRCKLRFLNLYGTGNDPVISHSEPRTGCSRAVLNKNSTLPAGSIRRRTNVVLPYRAHRVLLHAL